MELNLNFRANDLKPSLDIKYAEKWKPIGETKAMNLEEMLKDFLPEGMSLSVFMKLSINAQLNGDKALGDFKDID